MTVTKRPTIRKVAEHAGVSRMTVSRVLKGRDSLVSPKLKERVLNAVRELEYVPVPPPSRQNQRVETRIIGVVFDGTPMEGPFGLPAFIGLRDSAQKYDYDLLTLIREVPDWMAGQEELQFLSWRCDGVIFVSPRNRYKTIEAMTKYGIPVVCCHTADIPATIPRVVFDNFGAMHGMTSHLVAQGHTNIMHVASQTKRTDFALRVEGYKKAMIDAGLNPVVLYFDYKNHQSVQEFFELIKQHRITALNCVNDRQAFCVWQTLDTKNIRVPQDMSLTGMDNVHQDIIMRGLTTISVPHESTGKISFKVMMQLIEGGDARIENIIPHFEIVERTSVRNLKQS